MRLADLPRAKRIASDLTLLKNELGKLGLFKAMHGMDAVIGALGFEIEEHLMEHAKEAAAQEAVVGPGDPRLQTPIG